MVVFDEFDVNGRLIERKQFLEEFDALLLQLLRLFVIQQPNGRIKHLVDVPFPNFDVNQHLSQIRQQLLQQFELLRLSGIQIVE